MAQTFTETIGMLDLMIGHLNNPGNAATLTAKGLDVAATKTRMTAEKESLVQLDAEQEALKVSLQKKTEALQAATAEGYIDASAAPVTHKRTSRFGLSHELDLDRDLLAELALAR